MPMITPPTARNASAIVSSEFFVSSKKLRLLWTLTVKPKSWLAENEVSKTRSGCNFSAGLPMNALCYDMATKTPHSSVTGLSEEESPGTISHPPAAHRLTDAASRTCSSCMTNTRTKRLLLIFSFHFHFRDCSFTVFCSTMEPGFFAVHRHFEASRD